MFDWNTLLTDVQAAITALEPVIAAASPQTAAAISIAEKVIQGAIAAEPAAIALYGEIKGGTVTPEQLASYIADNDAKNAQLQADIAAKLAATPA